MNPSFRPFVFASLLFGLFTLLAGAASAEILVRVEGVRGGSTMRGYEGWFSVESFSFSIERSGGGSTAKAGAADIRTIASMDGVEITKSLDAASSALMQAAMNGSRIANAEIAFVTSGRDGRPSEILRYTLDVVTVSSWSTSADAEDVPEETITLEFARIAFAHGRDRAGWDRTANKPWSPQR